MKKYLRQFDWCDWMFAFAGAGLWVYFVCCTAQIAHLLYPTLY